MEFPGIEDIVEHEERVQNKCSEDDGIIEEAHRHDVICQHALRRFGLIEQEAKHVYAVLCCGTLGGELVTGRETQ